jgi:hypothetical protein
MDQLVGLRCAICRERIDSIIDGRFCDGCDYPVHNDCARAAGADTAEDVCPDCGADLGKITRRAARRRAGARHQGPPYPVSKVCPECGHDKYEKRRPKGWVAFTDDRVCKECGTRYSPPTPLWAALVFIVGGLLLAGAGAIFFFVFVLSLRGGRFPAIDIALEVGIMVMGGLAAAHGFRCLANPGRG